MRNENVRFIRKDGRVIPIRRHRAGKKAYKTAKERRRKASYAAVGAAGVLGVAATLGKTEYDYRKHKKAVERVEDIFFKLRSKRQFEAWMIHSEAWKAEALARKRFKNPRKRIAKRSASIKDVTPASPERTVSKSGNTIRDVTPTSPARTIKKGSKVRKRTVKKYVKRLTKGVGRRIIK